MAPAVGLDFAFADPEDAMGDWEQVDPPEVSTPEHWSDVGALSARMGLMEHQLQSAQAQLSQIASQMAAVAQLGHNLQHLEMQMVLQRQQHQEDIVKIMAAQAVSLSNLAPTTRAKARPGPRERQKLREERRAQEMEEAPHPAGSSSATTTSAEQDHAQGSKEVSMSQGLLHPEPEDHEPPSSLCETDAGPSEVSEVPTPGMDKEEVPWKPCPPEAAETSKAALAAKPRLSTSRWPKASWCGVVVAWSLYLARDMWPLPHGTIEDDKVFDAPADEWAESMAVAQGAATRLRELGHLQLSISDCQGAANLFARAEALLGNSSAPSDQVLELRRERGFALVCAQRFRDGAALLQEALRESMQASSPIHLPALVEEEEPGPSLAGPVHFLNALSFAYFYLGEFSRAKTVLETAVKLYPQNPLIWNNLGAVHLALGDLPRADKALHAALARASKLTGDHTSYYQQLVSNNIHTQRRHSQGDTSELPLLEIFNCMVTDVSDMVASTDVVQLKQQFQSFEADAAEAGVDASSVVETSKAVLSMEREFVLCP